MYLILFQGHWKSITTILRATSKGFGKVSAKGVIFSAASHVQGIHRISGAEQIRHRLFATRFSKHILSTIRTVVAIFQQTL